MWVKWRQNYFGFLVYSNLNVMNITCNEDYAFFSLNQTTNSPTNQPINQPVQCHHNLLKMLSLRTHVHSWRVCKLVKPPWKQLGILLLKLKTSLPRDPEIVSQSQETYTRIFMTPLFLTTPARNDSHAHPL